ncbi:MAG: ribosome silencing factor [Chromatiales bacterium]|nr:ribosome silencing factor [Chromatiales bacterium]
MDSSQLVRLIERTLEDIKAREVTVLDIGQLSTIADFMIVASGTSDRHVRAIADRVVEAAEGAGIAPLGVEGQDGGEWVLVDLGDVIVHLMQPEIREFYKLESLWSVPGEAAARRR